jgi:hypothetical protein
MLGDDNRLMVSSDCNSCGGGYTFCGNQSLDATFTNILQQSATISVDDDELIIQSAAGTLTFEE